MTKKNMPRTDIQLRENVDTRIAKRLNSIKESEESVESKKAYIAKLEKSMVVAQEAHERKMENIQNMIESVETGVEKEKARIEEREANLNELLKVKEHFEKVFDALEMARAEEVEIKDDMSKGMTDFAIIENKIVNIKKKLAAVSDKAGSIFYNR